MGQLTSTTSSFTFLKSQLASSLAPLQVHPGRGGTSTPSQLIYFMPYYSPYCWYPLPSLLINILLHGREMSTALSRPHRQEGHQGPGGTGVQPGGRGEPEILSHWTILRGVHFMPWCFISGGSHGWLFEQEKFLSHPPFSSPYCLSPQCPKRSTCRSLTYIHRIYHYILKCCSIFFPQPQFYFQHTYPRVLILWFPVQVWIWS